MISVKSIVISLFVLIISQPFCPIVKSHSDCIMTYQVGNITIKFKTGFRYEEEYKVDIIARLADSLLKSVNFQDSILLDFKHSYIDDIEPEYYISFGDDRFMNKGEIGWQDYRYPLFESPIIVISQISRWFDVEKTLKLVEYAIKNQDSIERNQYLIERGSSKILSIDTSLIKGILREDNSNLINELISRRVHRRIDIDYDSTSIQYYWQNKKFHFYYIKNFQKNDSTFITLDNVFKIYKLYRDEIVVFDTDSSFYYFRVMLYEDDINKLIESNNFSFRYLEYPNIHISKRQIINNKFKLIYPYNLVLFGNRKLSIYFEPLEEFFDDKGNSIDRIRHSRHLIYDINKDILIQDLDQLVEEEIKKMNKPAE